MIRRCLIVVVLLLCSTLAAAQSAIPAPEQFLGYKLGEQFTPYDRILAYFDELSRKSSLITVQKFGETYEGRPLVLATITSARNRAMLDRIHQNMAELVNGDQTDAAHAAEI
ncbi:MAG: zinc carboxypeptidase, partial [Acidobacteriota bacterium]